MKKRNVSAMAVIFLTVAAVCFMGGCEPKEGAAPSVEPKLFLSLDQTCDTPDAMTMAPDGSIILACPNFLNEKNVGKLMKIGKDNKAELFYTIPPQGGSTHARPMGLDFGPDGNIYVADNQYFTDKDHKSRLLRIVIEDGKAVRTEVAVDGFKLSNAVIWKGNDVFVSDTFFDLADKPGMSGIYKISKDEMDKGTVKLKSNAQDERLIATFTTIPNHRNDPAGADGMTIDSEGNLYTGMFGDGAMYKIEFNEDGTAKEKNPKPFVRVPELTCVDGIFYDAKRNVIIVTDSEKNAIHLVTPEGKRTLLWENDDTDGSDGLLDQPCEPLMRGDELIIVNFDWPFPGLKNTKHDEYHTLSVIQLAK
ncbi:MAG: SMP-30/gluconolactonase/LRE family protein [Phycisphaerae bacterium]|nr:SMP-30/gluconolactonase/LRE family protein [Phycisphaerae bacterium]